MKNQDGPNNRRLAIEHETLPHEKEWLSVNRESLGSAWPFQVALQCQPAAF